jgi:hypothetical protein
MNAELCGSNEQAFFSTRLQTAATYQPSAKLHQLIFHYNFWWRHNSLLRLIDYT